MNGVENRMDKYYQSLFLSDGKEKIISAGYLEEQFIPDFKGVIDKSKVKNKGIILLTTGSFGLMHEGHLSMMEQAKEELENQGFEVAGGFFSFSHDDYVLSKSKNMPSLKERISHAKNLIKDSSWLNLDLWEALLPGVVNFTTVLTYFEQNFPEHEIRYVFGKTEYSFSWAFKHHGKAVYVPSENISPTILDLLKKETPNVLITSASKFSHLNSRDLRPWYVLRDDSSFFPMVGIEVFKSKIIKLLEKASGYAVKTLNPEQQLVWAKKQVEGEKTLSLDIYYKGTYQLELSRLFQVKDSQTKGIKLMERWGSPSVSDQVKKIPPGNYTLVDDDVASGETIERVKALLPSDVVINKVVVLSEVEGRLNIFDIVDLRDFIIGAPGGGLQVIDDKGIVSRAPYIFPFVNLSSRAKISKLSQVDFTKEILDLNIALYTINPKTIQEIDGAQQQFFTAQGFDKNLSIAELCKKMKESL